MIRNEKTPGPEPSRRRSAKLRLVGILALVLGIGGAGILYWIRSPDLSDDPSMLGFNKPAERQMGLLYGKMGTLIEDWTEDLKKPGTQAILIASFSALVAAGCFYFARLVENDDRPV